MDQEVSKALYGIKEMKEVMASNEEKHANLMKSLVHSGEKKKVSEQSFFLKTLKLIVFLLVLNQIYLLKWLLTPSGGSRDCTGCRK